MCSSNQRAFPQVVESLAARLVCDRDLRAWTSLECYTWKEDTGFLYCIIIPDSPFASQARSGQRTDGPDESVPYPRLPFFPMAIGDPNIFHCYPITREVERENNLGFVSIGEATALLSHRHAARSGDYLLIWSLLISDDEDRNPIGLWERQIGRRIPPPTPRSQVRHEYRVNQDFAKHHFPQTALQRTDVQSTGSNVYPTSDGRATSDDLITREGLRAKWLIYVFSNISTSTVAEETAQNFGLPGPCIDLVSQQAPRI